MRYRGGTTVLRRRHQFPSPQPAISISLLIRAGRWEFHFRMRVSTSLDADLDRLECMRRNTSYQRSEIWSIKRRQKHVRFLGWKSPRNLVKSLNHSCRFHSSSLQRTSCMTFNLKRKEMLLTSNIAFLHISWILKTWFSKESFESGVRRKKCTIAFAGCFKTISLSLKGLFCFISAVVAAVLIKVHDSFQTLSCFKVFSFDFSFWRVRSSVPNDQVTHFNIFRFLPPKSTFLSLMSPSASNFVHMRRLSTNPSIRVRFRQVFNCAAASRLS